LNAIQDADEFYAYVALVTNISVWVCFPLHFTRSLTPPPPSRPLCVGMEGSFTRQISRGSSVRPFVPCVAHLVWHHCCAHRFFSRTSTKADALLVEADRVQSV
jgi:hypothetical protein